MGFIMIDLAIIVPCYNEACSIAPTLRRICDALEHFDRDWHIYVYDNNSTDKTRINIQGFLMNNRCLMRRISVNHCYIQGKGNVMRQAFSEIQAHTYAMIDGDDTYDPTKLPLMYDAITRKRFDMVVGNRLSSGYFVENKRRFHNFGNRFMKHFVNLLFGVHYHDILSGFRMFSYRFVKTFAITGGGFTLETEMSIHAAANHLAVLDVSSEYKDRDESNPSKLHTIRDGFKVICKMLSLFQIYRPILFYGLISVLLFVLGFGLVVPVFVDFYKTGLVAKFPTLIVSGFIILAGLLSFCMGILQNGNKFRQRQNFERSLIQAEMLELK